MSKFYELFLRCKRNKWTTGIGAVYFVIRAMEKQWPAYKPVCDDLCHGLFILLALIVADPKPDSPPPAAPSTGSGRATDVSNQNKQP